MFISYEFELKKPVAASRGSIPHRGDTITLLVIDDDFTEEIDCVWPYLVEAVMKTYAAKELNVAANIAHMIAYEMVYRVYPGSVKTERYINTLSNRSKEFAAIRPGVEKYMLLL